MAPLIEKNQLPKILQGPSQPAAFGHDSLGPRVTTLLITLIKKNNIPVTKHLRAFGTTPILLPGVLYRYDDLLHFCHLTHKALSMRGPSVTGQIRLPGEVTATYGTHERPLVGVLSQVLPKGLLPKTLRAKRTLVFQHHFLLLTEFLVFFKSVSMQCLVEVAFGLGVGGEEALAAVPHNRRVMRASARELTSVEFDVAGHFLGEYE